MADRFDLGQALEDFELVGRLREARKFPRLVTQQMRISPDQLGPLFETVAQGVDEGLSLRSAGALAGVSHRVLAFWIRRADDQAEPWASWLASILRDDAVARRRALSDLRKLAALDGAAQRDLIRLAGQPTALEKELDLLRRSKTASADSYFAPVDAASEFRAESAASKASKAATDKKSVEEGQAMQRNRGVASSDAVEGVPEGVP